MLLFIGVFMLIFLFSLMALRCFSQSFNSNQFAFVSSEQDQSRTSLPPEKQKQMGYLTNIQEKEELRNTAEPRLETLETESPIATGRNLFTEAKE